jgi:hypothetical protein
MTVQVLKLVNDESVLTEVVEENDDKVVCRNPVVLMLNPENMSYVMMPGFLPLARRDSGGNFSVTIQKSHIICSTLVDPKAEDSYNQQFGNLTVPSKSLYIP